MTYQAYKDQARKYLIKAENAINNGIYYCQNLDCSAELTKVTKNGNSISYFAALHKGKHHIAYCPYSSNNSSNWNSADFNEKNFNVNELLKNIMKGTISKPSAPNNINSTTITSRNDITTILQMYNMCKSLELTEHYNDYLISDILFDIRSSSYNHYYKIENYKEENYKEKNYKIKNDMLVECVNRKGISLYDSNLKNELWLSTRSPDEINCIHLIFNNEQLYKDIRKLLYNSDGAPVIIFGFWQLDSTKHANLKTFSTKINNKRQLKLLKDK